MNPTVKLNQATVGAIAAPSPLFNQASWKLKGELITIIHGCNLPTGKVGLTVRPHHNGRLVEPRIVWADPSDVVTADDFPAKEAMPEVLVRIAYDTLGLTSADQPTAVLFTTPAMIREALLAAYDAGAKDALAAAELMKNLK